MVDTTCTSWQLVGQQLCCGHLLHPQHDQRVEVSRDLAGFGGRADPRFHVGPGLRVRRHLKSGATGLVQQRDELVADQLVELVGVDGDPPRSDLARQSTPWPELVQAAGHAGEIREHGVAHRARHLVVRQRIEPDIDDPAQIDHRGPVEHRPPVGRIIERRRQQRRSAPGGELLHQGQK
jgi:hypothetical protein